MSWKNIGMGSLVQWQVSGADIGREDEQLGKMAFMGL